MAKYNINLKKTYTFPEEIKTVYYNNSILVISPSTAKWIVLDSEVQLAILYYLKDGHSIEEVIASPTFDIKDTQIVITQLEARHFCDRTVRSNTESMKNLHIYLTNKCNLACPHCYMFAGKASDNELSTEEVLKLMCDYRNSGGQNVTLSGGEPSIRSDFETIVQNGSELGLRMNVLSNGVLMDEDRIRKIAHYLASVQISIDGYSDESNSVVRGKGSFEKALETVNNLINYGVETSIAITPPYDELKNHVEEYVIFAKELVSRYAGQPLSIKFSEELLPGRVLYPQRKQVIEYITLMEEVQKKVYGPNYDIINFVRTLKEDTIMDNCMFGSISVASNGDIYFCARISDLLPAGNIRTTPFPTICQLAKKAEEATSVTRLKPCGECELRFICGGGCRIDEFPSLVKRSTFNNLDINAIPARQCSQEVKTKFYEIMIRSNKFFYRAVKQ